jgi:hypothetical protein
MLFRHQSYTGTLKTGGALLFGDFRRFRPRRVQVILQLNLACLQQLEKNGGSKTLDSRVS